MYGHVHLLYSGLLCVCSCSLLKYIKRDDGSVRRSPSPVYSTILIAVNIK